MSDTPHVAESFHILAEKLQRAGIDERAYTDDRDARLALVKAENPNARTLSDIINEDNSEKQLAELDREYARIKMESEAAAKKKQDEMTQLVNDHFPAPPMKEH